MGSEMCIRDSIDMMGLSAREMEIIDLVADGLTNQEIAVKLTISKRTVDNHVSNMFTKTGSKKQSGTFELGNGQRQDL